MSDKIDVPEIGKVFRGNVVGEVSVSASVSIYGVKGNLLAEIPMPLGWTNVKDQMPELHEEVMLYDYASDRVGMGHLSHIGGDSYQWNLYTTGGAYGSLYFHGYSFDRITYWRLLPDPPELP